MKIELLRRDEHVRYVRKPANIPTTFGNEQSFLELVMEMKTSAQWWQGAQKWSKLWVQGEVKSAWRQGEVRAQLQDYMYLGNLDAESRKDSEDAWDTWDTWDTETVLDEELLQNFVEEQQKIFSAKEERWLVNRLDTATAGYIYVAADAETYAARPALQQSGKIRKHYHALVHGDMRYMLHKNTWESADHIIHLAFPIGHQLHLDDRMVAIVTDADTKKIRWTPQACESLVSIIKYIPEDDMTLVEVVLTKGVRHQIRVHLAAVGYPLVGDVLYGKHHYEKFIKKMSAESTLGKNVSERNVSERNIPLHLWSMWCDQEVA